MLKNLLCFQHGFTHQDLKIKVEVSKIRNSHLNLNVKTTQTLLTKTNFKCLLQIGTDWVHLQHEVFGEVVRANLKPNIELIISFPYTHTFMGEVLNFMSSFDPMVEPLKHV